MRTPEDRRALMPRLFSFFIRGAKRSEPFVLPADVTSAGSILFIDSGDVTDLLFAAPVVNYFTRHFPGIRTAVLVEAASADIVKTLMRVNVVMTYERSQLRLYTADYLALVRKLRARRFDAAVLLDRHYSFERLFLAFAAGGRIRIGFAHPLAYPFINCEIRCSDSGYRGGAMLRILPAIGLRPEEGWDAVSLGTREVQHARQLVHFWKPERDLIMVGVDPSRGKTKHHVIPEIVAYLANNLASRRRVKFLVFANPWEEGLVRDFARELKGAVIDLVPANLAEAIALLAQCDLFIGGNTNLFHFSALLNVPTIGLFTDEDRERWTPAGRANVRIFQGTRGEKLSLKDFFASVEEVLAARPTVSA